MSEDIDLNTLIEYSFYGYSKTSNSLEEKSEEICEDVDICGHNIYSTHPKQNKSNNLIQTAISD